MKWHPIKDWYEEKLDPEGVYLFTFRDDPNDIEHLGVDMGKFELGVSIQQIVPTAHIVVSGRMNSATVGWSARCSSPNHPRKSYRKSAR